MSRHLTATAAGYALLLMVWSVWRAVGGRGPDGTLLIACGFLELVLVAQALAEAVRLAGGARAAEPATHVGYLVASVLVLPLALSNLAPRRTRWDAGIVGAGLLAAAVVTLRLQVTGA